MRYAFNLGVRWRTPPTAAPVTDGVNRDSATDETPAAVAEAETQSLLVGAAEENMLVRGQREFTFFVLPDFHRHFWTHARSTLGQNMAALTEQYRSVSTKAAPITTCVTSREISDRLLVVAGAREARTPAADARSVRPAGVTGSLHGK